MSEPRFIAKRWERAHVDDWNDWIGGASTTRVRRASVLATAVMNLTVRWTGSWVEAERVVRDLPETLGRCNEIEFSSDSETLAYTIWHLVDRYSRILHVLDELFRQGDLPLRKTRLAALEIGAGPSPALMAVRDFYLDCATWAQGIEGGPEVIPATHLLSLDRGAAWSHLVHGVSEELLALDPSAPPHGFGIDYKEFEAFSVKGEHHKAIERIARGIVAEPDSWDEYVDLATARTEAVLSKGYPPGAMDLIVLCNFVTDSTMTSVFSAELVELAASLTPGGVLLVLGSASGLYDSIFRDLNALLAQSNVVRRVLDITEQAPHPDPRLGKVVDAQLVSCLGHCRSLAPEVFSEVAPTLPRDIRDPGAATLKFPEFRAMAFKRERLWRAAPRSSRVPLTD